MSVLLDFLSKIEHLTDAAAKDLESCMQRQTYAKGDHLLRIGEVSTQAYFLEKGLVRGYYANAKGEEFTCWLHSAPRIFASFKSFSSEQPGKIGVNFLEKSIVQSIAKKDLMYLCDQHKVLQHMLQYSLQEAYNRLIEHNMLLQSMDAKERYKTFNDLHPHLIDRVNLGHIATYLGINQATLSRIRTKAKQ
jgi:CRP-like cAMP-binding protein